MKNAVSGGEDPRVVGATASVSLIGPVELYPAAVEMLSSSYFHRQLLQF